MQKGQNAHILVRIPENKRQKRIPAHRWKDKIKIEKVK
jgi:hypothetical protein